MDIFLLPPGSLWFPSSAPSGPMFPRYLVTDNPFDPIPPTLIQIIMVRLAHNTTLLSLLKRKPENVQIIRKSMSPFVIPSRDPRASSPKPLELMDLLPRKHVDKRTDPFKFDVTLRALSLMLSQSYLSLFAQIFRSLPMHLNDRNELSDLIDGVNKVLLAHGDDIGIVSQAMIGK